MADAVLSRTGVSVTLPIRSTQGGQLAVGRDIGKPNVTFNDLGREDPKPQDHFSARDTWTVIGRFDSATAYADAQQLAEDIIKPQFSDTDTLTLDLSDLPNRGTYDVAPVSEQAARLTYTPGVRNTVEVQLSLTQVNATFSAGGQVAQATQSPDAGSGVKITDGTDSVTLTSRLSVTRTVGRPGGKLVQRPGTLPNWFDLNKPAADAFELSGDFTSSTAEADAKTLEETLMRARQGTDSLTLHFLGNTWGLDAYSVAPDGSQALRTSFQYGETGVVRSDTINLKVVDTT